MTRVEAFRELGVELGAEPAAIRRAYLRLVKTRSPERDPEGFKRLRLAYELAREGVEAGSFEATASSLPGVPASTAEEVHPPEPSAPASDEVPLSVPQTLHVRLAATDPRERASELLHAFAERENAGLPTTELLRPGVALYLALLEQGDVGTAAHVVVALDRAARGSASLLRAFEADAALRWSLASELWAAHRGVPLEVVARLAEAIRTDDFGVAAATLVGLRKARPDLHAATSRALVTFAPTLAKRLAARLGDWTTSPSRSTQIHNWHIALLLAFGALAGLTRFLGDPGRASRPSTWGIPGLTSQARPKARPKPAAPAPAPADSAPSSPQDAP